MIGTKILAERKSKFNGNLRVIRSLGLGTYIQSDGLTQSGGVVEGIWKRTLKRIRNSKFEIQNCLILGLGGGTVAKLLRKYWPKAKITGIDIDSEIVDLGNKYLGLGEVDLDIKIQDAGQEILGSFDLTVVDLYNGDRFPSKFETKKFLSCLTDSKIVVFNRLFYKDKRGPAMEFGEKLKKIFRNVEYYYPGVNVMFICSN